MTDLRTAAQQAIALICSARLCEVNSMSSRQEMLRLLIEATDLLRAALAQPSISQQVVDEQAEDEGLWFRAETASEAYLQQELRRLHAAVEEA